MRDIWCSYPCIDAFMCYCIIRAMYLFVASWMILLKMNVITSSLFVSISVYLLTNICCSSGWYCDVQLRWNLAGIAILEFPLWIDFIAFEIVLSYYCIGEPWLYDWTSCPMDQYKELKLCSKCMQAYCLYKPALGWNGNWFLPRSMLLGYLDWLAESFLLIVTD